MEAKDSTVRVAKQNKALPGSGSQTSLGGAATQVTGHEEWRWHGQEEAVVTRGKKKKTS